MKFNTKLIQNLTTQSDSQFDPEERSQNRSQRAIRKLIPKSDPKIDPEERSEIELPMQSQRATWISKSDLNREIDLRNDLQIY